MLFAATIVILTLNTMKQGFAVPLLDLRNTLEQDVLNAMVTSECSPKGDCWEWLPMEKIHDVDTLISEEQPVTKLNVRREASNVDPNAVIESWGGKATPLNRKVHQLSLVTKQAGNRLSKKDGLMPRSWSAGGMPFSVLYMNPHGPRSNHGSTGQQELGKVEAPTPPITQPNSRIALRNGSGGTQPRRQYSIIPQLFISYGWGPFGK